MRRNKNSLTSGSDRAQADKGARVEKLLLIKCRKGQPQMLDSHVLQLLASPVTDPLLDSKWDVSMCNEALKLRESFNLTNSSRAEGACGGRGLVVPRKRITRLKL